MFDFRIFSTALVNIFDALVIMSHKKTDPLIWMEQKK